MYAVAGGTRAPARPPLPAGVPPLTLCWPLPANLRV